MWMIKFQVQVTGKYQLVTDRISGEALLSNQIPSENLSTNEIKTRSETKQKPHVSTFSRSSHMGAVLDHLSLLCLHPPPADVEHL